ncbi:MAG: hypothetical protein EXX96DRAFT_475335 [Benjaminiella poitrasii]|nr:MAG: hypothetical protein EXX96DRAFT_475335 [Benjaminiella poitrasii]
MKATKYLTLPLAYAVCLLLLANEAQAKASTTKQLEDISQWTKDQVQAYLNKYQIYYDQNVNDQSLWQTVQKYRDAAAANTNIFINNNADSISQLVDGLKLKLEKQYNLAANSVDGLVRDINHELKQLELSGNLKQEKVKQALDRYQTKAVKQKYVTTAQWKEISNDISSSFAGPTWYQRILGAPSHSKFYDDNSFHTWLTTTISQRLETNKQLTKEEVQSVIDTLKDAITRTSGSVQDLSKLGSKAWWDQISRDLEKQGKFKQAQAEAVVDSLKDEVNAYKIFAIDYANEAADQTKGYLAAARQYVMDTGNNLYQAVFHPFQSNPQKEAQVNSALYSASSAAPASATDAAAASASSMGAYVTDTAYDAKQGFGRFWRQKELETYRKVGYTEAHVNWIENYLSKTFQDKKDLTKDSAQSAIKAIRQYLVSAKVQTVASIDSQLKSLEALIESWRRYIVRDEL